MIRPTYFSLLLLIIGMASCKEDEKNNSPQDNFNRKALFTNIGENIVLPTFLHFVDVADSLQQASSKFQATRDAASLQTLQTAWLNAKKASKQIELLKFGPLNDTKMYSLIDKWASNTGFIEDFISGTDPITESFINGKGATSKGLPAIEYLLFEENINSTVTTLSNDSRRMDYLMACCKNLYQESLEIASLWSPLGDNYVAQYAEKTQSGLDGSLSQTVNQMSSHLEFMMVTKIGKPLGKDLTSGPNKIYLEAYRSQTSKELLIENLSIFKTLFTGGGEQGFDDYLNHLNAKSNGQLLSKAILDQTAKVETQLNTMNGSLAEALTSSPEKVEELYDGLKKLLVLVKVDMTSALSVTLTFSDNDGD